MGGWDAPLNKYPWFAWMIKSDGFAIGCGSFLVAPEWILTAAHCVDEGVEVKGVEVGRLCRQNHNCNQALERIAVDRVVIDPLFKPHSLSYDLALIKLSNASTIPPATLDSGFSPSFSNGRPNLMAIGFGVTYDENNLYTQRLLEVEVEYVTNSKCEESLGPGFPDEMLCAGGGTEGTCHGDSGGPLWDSIEDIVIGVTSWSSVCKYGDPGKW